MSILGTQTENAVQGHISKMFDNVESLGCNENATGVSKHQISSLNSMEKECLQFLNSVYTTNVKIENWMSDIVKEMKKTMHRYFEA